MKTLNKHFKTWANHKELCMNAHTNFIHNSQALEITPYAREMIKKIIVFIKK